MADNKLYLKESVYFEPLFNHWYAWPYLIPPLTSARHMVNTHRRIMSSFVNNYKLHILAQDSPELVGGEFLNCTEEQVGDIKNLITDIDENLTDVVELSKSVKVLDDLLRSHTSGETVETLYELVPENLKGYVELVMDMYHNPTYRVIESLLYRSEYYKPQLQSLSFGSLDKIDERPFVLSTPRLPDANHLQAKADFNHALVDKVFAARTKAMDESDVAQLFESVELSGGLNYRDLFTTEPPKKQHQPVKEGVRMSYLGHAGFLIETSEVSMLIDPVIANPREELEDGLISFSELPEHIDYICLTHNHQDHVNLETLLQLRHKTGKLVVPKNNGGSLADPSLRLLLKQFGFDVIEMDDLDEINVADGRIMSIPFLGEHGDLNVRSKSAWYFELHGKKIFIGADSSNLEPQMYRHIQRYIGDIDILAIGMECIGAP